jgi:predicted glycosyltransferase
VSGRVLFYVQHLLGIGHLKRAATLARAFDDAGLEVTFVSGGHEVPGLNVGGAKFVQLPPVRAVDVYFKVLVDATDTLIDDAFRARRRDVLLQTFHDTRPDVIVTELFPFGRRQLRFELEPMLEAARATSPRPRIVCSVRDILVEPDKPERAEEMLERIERHYDLVLVHGDPSLIPFDTTFPLADRIADRIRYTGYVVEEGAAPQPARPRDGVVVSAGGGAVSEALFRAAIAARPLTRLKDAPWRILCGHALPEPAYRALHAEAPAGVTVERARPDFIALLRGAALSISQGGYNTMMEVLATRTRAVVVPYAGGLETEQTLRATLLAERGALGVVDETALSPETIAHEAERMLDRAAPETVALDVAGGKTSAAIISSLIPSPPFRGSGWRASARRT